MRNPGFPEVSQEWNPGFPGWYSARVVYPGIYPARVHPSYTPRVHRPYTGRTCRTAARYRQAQEAPLTRAVAEVALSGHPFTVWDTRFTVGQPCEKTDSWRL